MTETTAQRFVALTELADHPSNAHVDWRLPLPEYSGVDNLFLDTHAANRIADLGMLATVTFAPGKQPEQDQPSVGGMGGDGTASAAVSLGFARRRPRPQTQLQYIFEDGKRMPFWGNATIGIDVDGISDRLSRQQQLREPERWAAELSHAAGRGLRRAALKNTAYNHVVDGIAMAVMIPPSTLIYGGLFKAIATGIDLDISFPNCLYAGGALAYGTMAHVVFGDMRERGEERGLEKGQIPYSVLMFGADRLAMIGLAAARNRQLIRYLPDGHGEIPND